MQSRKARLDRFISAKTGINRSDVRLLLAKRRVHVDGIVVTDINQVINQFSLITLDDLVLQENHPVYIMLNKPPGVVSATKDDKHPTVIDLLKDELREDLHIVGRLDFNSSGLLLLTNNGDWSRRLTAPESKVVKTYQVTVEKPISEECIQAFANGMFFPYENLTTRPAKLEKLAENVALVSLVEGRYHQIKRMFGRFRNKVVTLHRVSVGNLQLDTSLQPGASRHLTSFEIENIQA